MAKKSLCVFLAAFLVTLNSAWASQPLPAGSSVDVGFSPSKGALDVVLKGIGAAKQQILVAAYSFTSKPIAAALLDAYRRGVKVFVVADRGENSKGYTALTYLANGGVPVRLNENYAAMHHKFLVIDGENVELGSFNFTSAATSKNAENALMLWHVQAVADAYSVEWKRLWDESAPLQKSY